MEQNKKWKMTIRDYSGEENFKFELTLDSTKIFHIDIWNEDKELKGGGAVSLATLIHMIKHIGLVGIDYKLWK